jgi:hypothetical protein
MSTPENRPPEEKPATDSDLQVQAVPGHGIPSQDPDPAAQLPLPPEDMEREEDSALAGGALIAGAAAGAIIGAVVSGPVGVVVGAGVGAVAGAVGAFSSTSDAKPKLKDHGRNT